VTCSTTEPGVSPLGLSFKLRHCLFVHILLINYEFPPLGGGAGNASAQIASHLAAQGMAVTVVTSAFGDLPRREIKNGVEILRIPTLRRYREKCSVIEMMIFLFSSLIFTLLRARRLRPDVTLAFFGIPCGPAALLLRWFFKIPYIVALRGGDVPGFLPEQLSVFHRLTNWLTRIIWHNAAALTANSNGLAELARNFDVKTPLHVIPNGVDRQFFFERSAPTQKPLRALFVGRLTRQKRIERLISVFTCLQPKSHMSLTIVGDGPERQALETLASELPQKRVQFLGWRDREQLTGLYREHDIFVLASDYEGMPNVVLEAMASSLAVVATPSAGTVELVLNGHNGYLVEASHPGEFEGRLLLLDADRTHLLELQRAASVTAASHTWDDVAAAYGALCHDVVAR
jgi:glycosyltransferase involved in cell wall biosynthesis